MKLVEYGRVISKRHAGFVAASGKLPKSGVFQELNLQRCSPPRRRLASACCKIYHEVGAGL
jgi:hypothetical protein